MGEFGRIESIDDMPDEARLVRLIRRAIDLKENGRRAPAEKKRERNPLPVPQDLRAALRKNARARSTFESFSVTNRRDYVEWIIEAKREETRRQRLKTAIQWMAEGKPRNWKYARG